jgi:hypothetical protein
MPVKVFNIHVFTIVFSGLQESTVVLGILGGI